MNLEGTPEAKKDPTLVNQGGMGELPNLTRFVVACYMFCKDWLDGKDVK